MGYKIQNIYVGTTKVRPTWRKPWVNTVAYRPLNSTTTVNDKSGNGYNLTQTWGSFGTYNGVDCFYNGWSTTGYFTLTSWANIPSGNTNRTILLWTYPTGYSSSYSRCFFRYGTSSAGKWVELDISSSGKYRATSGTTVITWGAFPTWAWSLLTFTTAWNTFNLYANSVLQGSDSSGTINTEAISSSYPLRLMRLNTSTSNSYQVRGYISEVIIENKTRTAQEIRNYYNQTKSNYWL